MNPEEEERLEHTLMLGRWLVNLLATTREELEKDVGQVWDTEELGRDFEVEGFKAPFVVARRKSTGKIGSLMFQHSPRYYWGWREYDGPPLSTLKHEDPENHLPDEPAEKEKGTM